VPAFLFADHLRQFGERRDGRVGNPHQTGPRVRAQHRRNRTRWQPGTLEKLIQPRVQHRRTGRIVAVHHLRAQRRAGRVLRRDLIADFRDGLLKRARLTVTRILAVFSFDADDRFQIQHRTEQPFQVADASAVNQVLERRQRIERVRRRADTREQFQDFFFRPTRLDRARGGLDLPALRSRQGFRVHKGDARFRHERGSGLRRVQRATQTRRDVDRENLRVGCRHAAIHFGEISRRRLRRCRKTFCG